MVFPIQMMPPLAEKVQICEWVHSYANSWCQMTGSPRKCYAWTCPLEQSGLRIVRAKISRLKNFPGSPFISTSCGIHLHLEPNVLSSCLLPRKVLLSVGIMETSTLKSIMITSCVTLTLYKTI